jgi:hypothetical protein
MTMKIIRWIAGLVALSLLHLQGLIGATGAAEAQYPLGSRIGLVPPPGITVSTTFPGFEDAAKSVYIRLIAMPGKAYAELETSTTNQVLKKQGVTVEKREPFATPGGKGLLIVARQQAGDVRFHKWMLIAPMADITVLVSFEIRDEAKDAYPESVIRTTLASTTVRASIPTQEQLALVPFQVADLAGFRVVRVLPGVAVQLTDGPQDNLDAGNQPHLVVSIAPGAPPDPRDRDSFARVALANGLPPLKDVRITSAEPMRLGGQQGHEMRATGKDPSTGAEIVIVQWLRFGSSGFMRIVGFAPKQDWTKSFMRFRAVRDGVGPR